MELMSEERANEVAANKKSRAWCFTINNPVKKILFPDGLPEGVKYVIYQLEKGAAGTPHLQGYIALTKPQRMGWLRKLTGKTAENEVFHVFDRAALIVAKGNADQNKTYCSKAEGRLEGPWTLGDVPKQGDRTDLREAAASLMRDGDIRAIDPAVFLKYASGCLKLAALAPPPRRDDLKVITICGPTGIGKSYAIHDIFPDIFVVNMGNSGLWWDGYTGQKAIMFEEFKGQVQLQKMLQILDPYPLRLEIKGGLIPGRFTVAFITSNYVPNKWYKNECGERDAEMAALNRRLDVGDETAIPKIPDGIRFIHVESRPALHQRLGLLKLAGMLPIKAPVIPAGREPNVGEPASPSRAAAAMAAAAPSPARAVPQRCSTVHLSDDDDEPPRLRRAVAHITIDAPDDADMVMIDNEPYVRTDIINQHAQSP